MLNFIFNLYRTIFAKKIFYRFNKFLYLLGLRGLGILNYENDCFSGEKYFLNKYIPKDKKDMIVFDVGANIGNYSKLIRKTNKNAKIYSFEPHPITFQKHIENTKQLDISSYNVGVGRNKGVMKLYDYSDKDGSAHASVYKGVIEKIHKGNVITHKVEIINLDEFVIISKIARVHLLKIDTEGHELEVLKGFEKFIRQNKIDLIHFEFNEMNTESRVFFKDFYEFLPNYNFHRMLPDGLAPIKKYNPVFCEIFAYQNIVAILKKS